MSPIPWRRRLLATCVAAPLLAIAACGGSGGGGDAGGAAAAACEPSDGPVELTFTSWVPGVEEAVALWNEQNPDIQVQAESVPAGNAGTYNNLFNALQANTAPDLSQVEYDSLSSFRLQDGLVDISQCAGIADASSQFVDWTWSQVQLGDEGVYAVPQDTGPMALFYRKDLFDAAGIPAPTTWEEYYQAGVALKAANPEVRITHFPQQDANWFTGLLWQNQASLFGIEGDSLSVTVDSPESRQVAEYWQRMIDEQLVATNLQGFSTELYSAWNTGTVATWVSAAWGYSTIRDNAPDTAGLWAVAPMPQWEAGGSSAGNWGGSTTAVFSGTEHPYEAAQFALWLNTDPASLEILNAEGGLFPAATAGQDLPALSSGVDFYGGQPIFDVFNEASGQVDTGFTWGPTMTDTYTALSDGFTAALNGQGTLSDALGAAQASSVDALRAQGIQVDG
ncbi:MAG: sugar ABC transporter substrate-binding protein [Pseudonocardiales bacterium]|nr:sugar ABC transporter substrate-binding protein [Pseudonocardiales bacterium]